MEFISLELITNKLFSMKSLFCIFFLFVGSYTFLNSQFVYAENLLDVPPPPAGINLSGIFETPSTSDSRIIGKNESRSQYVLINEEVRNQVGAIWSTENNKMDLSQDFETEMYIYFGNRGNNAADGMAFVMHNDDRATEMIGLGGASLGVWASERYRGRFDDAIQNSFAVEFDTHHNNEYDANVQKKHHIAWNYPGKESSYQDRNYLFGGGERRLVHNSVQYPGNISDGNWHKFVIVWDVEKKTLSYQFDQLTVVSVPIDVEDIFNPNRDPNWNQQVFWGFTGSTGDKYEINMVSFDEIPGLVEGQIKEDIFLKENYENVSVENENIAIQNESIKDKAVLRNSLLEHRISITYLGGRKQSWEEVYIKKTLNEYSEYQQGTLKISRDGGETYTSVSDDYWSLQQTEILEINIGTLDENNSILIISFDTKVKGVEESFSVKSGGVIADGLFYNEYEDSFEYSILANYAPILNLEYPEQLDMNLNEQFSFEGTWQDFDSDFVRFRRKVTNYTTGESNGIESTGKYYANTAGFGYKNEFSLDFIPAEWGMSTGKYAVDLWIVDFDKDEETEDPTTNFGGSESKHYRYIVNVIGVLEFGSVSNFYYGVVGLPVETELVFPYNNPQIEILDSRGTGNSWFLSVRIQEELTAYGDNDDAAYLSMYYIEKQQNIKLNREWLTIKQYQTTQLNENYQLEWGKKEGIAVRINNFDYLNSYKGTLNWLLSDVPLE